MARGRRKTGFKGDETLRDAQKLIQNNPITTAVAALAAGATATLIVRAYAANLANRPKKANGAAEPAKPATSKPAARRKKKTAAKASSARTKKTAARKSA